VAVVFVSSAAARQGHAHAAAPPDPLIAAAGDIACDPSSSNFRSGNGTSSSCKQKATSDLVLSEPVDAVLTLGELEGRPALAPPADEAASAPRPALVARRRWRSA